MNLVYPTHPNCIVYPPCIVYPGLPDPNRSPEPNWAQSSPSYPTLTASLIGGVRRAPSEHHPPRWLGAQLGTDGRGLAQGRWHQRHLRNRSCSVNRCTGFGFRPGSDPDPSVLACVYASRCRALFKTQRRCDVMCCDVHDVHGVMCIMCTMR